MSKIDTQKILQTFECLKGLGINRYRFQGTRKNYKKNKNISFKSKKREIKRRDILFKNQKIIHVKNSADYRKYTSSKWWRIRRKEFIKSNPFCFCCGKNVQEVHHCCYKRLYREEDNDLVSICRQCHEGIHTLILNDPTIKLLTGHIVYRELINVRID